jgi:chorismate mutase/prephenate dehydratase
MNEIDKKLEAIRNEIDGLDKELLALINRRAGLAKKVAQVKDGGGSPLYYRPEREAEVLRSLVDGNDGPLPGEQVSRIFQEVMSACRALQKPLAVAYLGPEGTFTESAAFKHFGHAIDALPVESIGAVFRHVESGAGDYGVVPIENSTEGVVGHTVDMFVSSDLAICGEVELRIHHCLMASADGLESIGKIFSHQQSFAQCRRWLDSNLPSWIATCRMRCAKPSPVTPRPPAVQPPSPGPAQSPGKLPLTITSCVYWPVTSRTSPATPRASS